MPDAAGVHRQPATDVGVLGADQNPPRTTEVAAHIIGGELELPGAVQIPGCRALRRKQFEGQPVRASSGVGMLRVNEMRRSTGALFIRAYLAPTGAARSSWSERS